VTDFPWRIAAVPDWNERIAVLDRQVRSLTSISTAAEYEAVALEAQRLANQALDARQNLKLENLARRLAAHAERLPTLRRLRIGLSGNRTLSYLLSPLRAAGLARGLLIEPVDIRYEAIRALAFGQSNALERSQPLDAVLLILDQAAFVGADSMDETQGVLEEARSFLARLAHTVHHELGTRTLLATIPVTGSRISSSELAIDGTAARFLTCLNEAIIEGARKHVWMMWDMAALAVKLGTDRWFDPVRFYEAKVPFRIELGPVVADHLCRSLAALSGKSCRALVLDLDDTLWGGSIGEDGIAGIRLGENSAEGEAYLAFQHFILSLRQRGIVLAICSKNTDAVAREPFQRHPEMLLREEHIAIFQANWDDKASNLHAIAEALNLGLESLAFIDDSAAERHRVRQLLPWVSVPEIGNEPALYPARIIDSGIFDHLPLTVADRERAESYRSRAASLQLKTKLGDYDQYLRSLKMTLSVSPFDAIDRARLAQLINKSNQFNVTTRRYSEAQVRQFGENPHEFLCWQMRLEDIFGKHGVIGVLIVRKLVQFWEIDTWLMSCRVLARGIEQTIANLLMAEAREAGVNEIVAEYRATARNALVADLFSELGFEQIEGAPTNARRYRAYPASHAALNTYIEVHRS
jgi:FkbH-like protein